MASFNIEEGADTDPSWYGTFYKPGDQDWWDKGAHKALGQSFLRALVRQVAPELGTAEAGDLGMSDARCDMAVPIAFPDILSAAGAGLCILRAPEENITSMEELLPTNRVVREWVSRSKVRGDARAALVSADIISIEPTHAADSIDLPGLSKKATLAKMTTAEQDAVKQGKAIDERSLVDLISSKPELRSAIHSAYIDLVHSDTATIADIAKLATYFSDDKAVLEIYRSQVACKTMRQKDLQSNREAYMLAALMDRRDSYVMAAVERVVGPDTDMRKKWFDHLFDIAAFSDTDKNGTITGVSFFSDNQRDLVGVDPGTAVQRRFRRGEMEDIIAVYTQYFRLLAIFHPDGKAYSKKTNRQAYSAQHTTQTSLTHLRCASTQNSEPSLSRRGSLSSKTPGGRRPSPG